MRLAVVSDIHGNLPALEAVLAEISRERVDRVMNLGDIVSGPLWPQETATLLRTLAWPTVRGNHERQLLTLPAERLSPTDAPSDDLQYFLESVTPDLGHNGSPGVRAASAAEVAERLGAVTAPLVLCGHTHVPRVVQCGDTLVVNPGSVGLPAFDDDQPHAHLMETGSPHARWALLEHTPAGWQVQQRLTSYDCQAAAQKAEAAGRGDWADALRTGRVGRIQAQGGG
jgi:putative phosphoesterase